MPAEQRAPSAPWGKRAAGNRLTSGNVGPPSADPRRHSHPVCRSFLTLIAVAAYWRWKSGREEAMTWCEANGVDFSEPTGSSVCGRNMNHFEFTTDHELLACH